MSVSVALRRDENPSEEPMQLRELLKQSGHVFSIDPRTLKVDPDYNVREMDSKETRQHIAALKSSIIANGVKVPLEVRLDDKSIYIVAGHCRHAAALQAIDEGHPIKAVPCIQERGKTSPEDRVVNLIISNSGKPLEPLEVAAVVKRLENFGWTDKQIAERLGWKSQNSVKQHREMQGLPENSKKRIRAGEISATSARHLAKSDLTPEEQEKLIAANLEENQRIKGKRARVTPKQIKRATAPKPAPVAPPTAPAPRPKLDESFYAPPEEKDWVEFPSAGTPSPKDKTEKLVELGGLSEAEAHAVAARALQQATLEKVEQQNGWHPDAEADRIGHPSALQRQGVKDLIEALRPFAKYADLNDLNERADDDVIEVPVRDLKRAWIVLARVCGDAS